MRRSVIMYLVGMALLAGGFAFSFIGVYQEAKTICSEELVIVNYTWISLPTEITEVADDYAVDGIFTLNVNAFERSNYVVEYRNSESNVNLIGEFSGPEKVTIDDFDVKELRFTINGQDKIFCVICYKGSKIIVSPLYLLVIPMVAAGIILGFKGMLSIWAEKIIEKRKQG